MHEIFLLLELHSAETNSDKVQCVSENVVTDGKKMC